MYAPMPPVVNASRVSAWGVRPLSTTDEIVPAVWTKARTVLPAAGSVEKVAVAVLPLATWTVAEEPFRSGTAEAADAHAVLSTTAPTIERPTPRDRRVRVQPGDT